MEMSTDPRQLRIEDILRMSLDPCERKHRGNELSKAAHKKIVHTKAETYQRILNYVRATGGATGKEIAAGLGKQFNAVSGRFSELKAMNKLKDSGARRDGSAVLILT
jgi:hypothetical protein